MMRGKVGALCLGPVLEGCIGGCEEYPIGQEVPVVTILPDWAGEGLSAVGLAHKLNLWITVP